MGYVRMIMVDIRKHQVIVISEFSVHAVGPILVISNNPKQFMIPILLSKSGNTRKAGMVHIDQRP
jgi:hypothetical protein